MKKFSFGNLIAILIFMAFITLPMILWHGMSLYETMDFDLGEKRNKATLSETFNAETFTSEYEKYFNDRLPFRSMLITMKTGIDAAIEKPYKELEKAILNIISGRIKGKVQADEIDGVIRLYMDDAVDMFFDHKLKKGEIDPYVTGINYPVKYLSDKVIIGQSDWTYLNLHNIKYYLGNNEPILKELEEDKKLYEYMQAVCKEHNKTIVFIICPEKEEIYPEYMPTMEIVDEVERPIKIRDYLATASDVTYIYPKEELLKKKLNYRLYKKYDSHWSDAGAFIATKILKDRLGIDSPSIRECRVAKVPESNKDLLFLAGVSKSSYPESFEYVIDYKPDIFVNTIYQDSEQEVNIFETVSNSSINKHLLIMGDSYRISMAKFLMKDFAKLTSVTFNYMDNSSVVDKAIKDCDIIVLQAVERNEDSTIPLMCKKILDILK